MIQQGGSYICRVPDILDRGAAVSLFAPDLEGGHQQDDELSVLHTDGHHVPLGAVADGACRVAQVHLVQHLLFPPNDSRQKLAQIAGCMKNVCVLFVDAVEGSSA